MKKLINWLKKEECGQGMVEYGLIIAGVAVIVMGAIFALGPIVRDIFNDIKGQIEGAVA